MKKKDKMRKEVQIFRESIQKVVVMLSGKKIPVAEKGNRAYVEYKSDGTVQMVCLPSIPDDASNELMDAIRGFLDHEVAHLLFTNHKLALGILGNKNSPVFNLWNAVEDVFIERRMGEVFSGSKRNLINTQRHVIAKIFEPKVGDAVKALARKPRELFLKFMLTPALRAWAGQTPFIEFMEPHWDLIREPVEKLEKIDISGRIGRLKTTEDCIKLAAMISVALKEDMEKPEGKKSPEKSDEKPDDKSTPDKVGSEPPTGEEKEPIDNDDEPEEEEEYEPEIDSKDTEEHEAASEEEDDGEAGDDEGEEEDEPDHDSEPGSDTSFSSDCDEAEDGEETEELESSSSSEPGESGESEDGESESTPGDTDSDEWPDSGEEDDDGDPQDGDASDGSSGTERSDDVDLDAEEGTGEIPLEAAIAELENSSMAPETSIEDALNAVMKGELSDAGDGSYRPYQRSYDFMGPIEDAEGHIRRTHKAFGSIAMYENVSKYRIDREGLSLFKRCIERHLSDSAAATLAKDLERAIASKNKVQFIPGQRRGKVHSANLYRLSMKDDRVFRRREDHKAVNACVQQVVDLSGSMNGQKIRLALACAYTIADALDRINVPNIITGFTTVGRDTKAEDAHGSEFSRYEGLMLPTIKDWHERTNTPTSRQRFGCLAQQFPLANNVDGESIMALVQHFAARTEDKKIMLIMSDGAPCAVGHNLSGHLRDVAASIEKSGQVEMLAVGILTDAPKRYYKHHVLVNKVEELGATVVKKLSSLILG